MEIRCPNCESMLQSTAVLEPTVLSPENGAECEKSRSGSSTRIGDYELLELIGQGGMGVVFKARHNSLDRIVALKLIRVQSNSSDDGVQRFEAEAKAAAVLQHSGIVTVFEIGEEAGTHFLSMEFIEGGTLSDAIKAGPLTPKHAASLVREIAKAVHFAHEQGVIHRDLKPSNVLLGKDGIPMVADFGLAKRVSADPKLTQTGAILGTPSYMPPEQARGEPVGREADIYSLGAILYCLLVGKPPFQAATTAETIALVVNEEVVSPRRLNPRILRDLETICLRAMERQPAKRFQSAMNLAEDLDRYLTGLPIRSRRIGAFGRFSKLIRRNPKTSSLIAVISILIVIGLRLFLIARYERRRHDFEARFREGFLEKIPKLKDAKKQIIKERTFGYVRAAKAYSVSKRYENAIECLEKALEIAPKELRPGIEKLLNGEKRRVKFLKQQKQKRKGKEKPRVTSPPLPNQNRSTSLLFDAQHNRSDRLEAKLFPCSEERQNERRRRNLILPAKQPTNPRLIQGRCCRQRIRRNPPPLMPIQPTFLNREMRRIQRRKGHQIRRQQRVEKQLRQGAGSSVRIA